MNENIEKILQIWHKRFKVEENQYSEFEDSDIEYFVGCLLYNHFDYKYALDTMKTIDLSYDFLQGCGDEYAEVMLLVKGLHAEKESEKIDFLINFIEKSKEQYSDDENYLLDRLHKHMLGIKHRFLNDESTKAVDFSAPVKLSSNPLLR